MTSKCQQLKSPFLLEHCGIELLLDYDFSSIKYFVFACQQDNGEIRFLTNCHDPMSLKGLTSSLNRLAQNVGIH